MSNKRGKYRAHKWMIADDDGTSKDFECKEDALEWLTAHDARAAYAINHPGIKYLPGENTVWQIWRVY